MSTDFAYRNPITKEYVELPDNLISENLSLYIFKLSGYSYQYLKEKYDDKDEYLVFVPHDIVIDIYNKMISHNFILLLFNEEPERVEYYFYVVKYLKYAVENGLELEIN